MMRTIPTLLGMTLALMLALPVALAAGGDTVARMAAIMSHINHYPSANEKDELAAIASDEGQPEAIRTIARAMMNMRHHVSRGDRQRLESIGQDHAQPQAVRQLATILARMNHHPGRQDRETLRAIAD